MAVSVECPGCKHAFAVPDDYAGKLGKCPKCGAVFRAPSTAGVSPPPVSPAAQKVEPPPVAPPAPPAPKPPKIMGAADAPPAVRAPVTVRPTPVTPNVTPVTPPAAPASPFPIFDAPAATGQPSSSATARHAGRGKSRQPMFWLAAAGGGVLVIAAVAAIAGYALSGNSASPNPTVASTGNNTNDANAVNTPSFVLDRTANEATSAAPQTLSHAELDMLWRDVHRRIVKLAVQTPHGLVTGTGFVIDSRGWVATNYHLIQDVESMSAQIAPDLDGTAGPSMPVSGTIAVNREHDLAILKLAPESTLTFTELSLQAGSQLQAGATLVACRFPPDTGNPLVECNVKQVIASGNLPPNTKATLRDRGLGDSDDVAWIEHTAVVDEPSQGGPLLNPQGEVVGINTQLSHSSTGGYAIHVKHLAALLTGATDEVKPFGSPRIAAADIPNLNIPPLVKPESLEPTPRPIYVGPAELTVANIVKLHEECKTMNWNPTTPGEYSRLQELSRLVTEAKAVEDDASHAAELRRELGAAAHVVLEDLAATAWRGDAQLAAVNKLAAQAFETPGEAVFIYGRVIVPSTRSQPFNGQPTVIMEMVGTGDLMVVSASENAEALEAASRWLLLGLHDPQTRFTLRIDDSPEKPAELIVPKYVVGAPQ